MKKKVLCIYCLSSIFSQQLFAFDSQKLDSAIQNFQAYADSICEKNPYIEKAMAAVGSISHPITDKITKAEAEENNKLRSALAGAREGMMSKLLAGGMGGDSKVCVAGVLKTVSDLKKLKQ
ncbi:MAG: hypothetical protein ACXVBE_11665 [Bdellovibrionota bacterium]